MRLQDSNFKLSQLVASREQEEGKQPRSGPQNTSEEMKPPKIFLPRVPGPSLELEEGRKH